MVFDRRITAALIAAGIFTATPITAAFAWDADGHEQVADIAWTRLTPAAKSKITAILNGALEPGYRPIGTSDFDARRAFREAAVFPDEIKRATSAPAYAATVESENHAFAIALPADNAEAIRCKTWHYYDTPIRLPKGAATPTIDPSNALAALTRAEDKLKSLVADGKDPGMQFWYLAWIEHVVGDLHQPLHCVSSYEFSPTGDAGGNGFHLAPDALTGRSSSLHSLWDGGITHAAYYKGSPSRAYEAVTARWTADATLQPSETDATNVDIKSWIDSSAHLADTVVYAGLTRDQAAPDDYLKRKDDLCRHQAVLAGHRLAAVLNSLLVP